LYIAVSKFALKKPVLNGEDKNYEPHVLKKIYTLWRIKNYVNWSMVESVRNIFQS
jgi:hypothetical protein